jgi:hypothetical protein
MQTQKEHKKLGKEKLERIIQMCEDIENRIVDPFVLNIEEIITIVKDYFPHWENPDELNLDAEVLHHLASVIKIQSEWVKHRSTSLYTDPFLIEEKIHQSSTKGLLEIFLKAWRPLIEFERISIHSLVDSLRYWEALEPIGERWLDPNVVEVAIGVTSHDELVKQRVLADREFSEELECYWEELKLKVAKRERQKIEYWDFIGADTYEETVQRAFLTSFLVTYGYATLDIDRLEETIHIEPRDKPQTVLTQQSTSVPIAVSCEEWRKWKRGEDR